VGDIAAAPAYNALTRVGIVPAPQSYDMATSDDLYIGQDLEIGGTAYLASDLYMSYYEGSQMIYFYEDGNREGESLTWNNGADTFVITDDLDIYGMLSKSAGSFKIDHPLDPANKYLYHSFVESPDMKNVYDGVAVLDESGEASVELPKYFEALNTDVRYQLTAIGTSAPNLHIAQKVTKSVFAIAGGKPGMEVSWQVTGIRRDPYAEANRIKVEVEKLAEERGKYLFPELYNKPDSQRIGFVEPSEGSEYQ